MEFGNLMKIVYGAHVISGAYSKINPPNAASDDDESAAVIQYLIHGKIAESKKNEKYVSEAISMTQKFADAAGQINEKLQTMIELAEQAAGTDSEKQKEELQEEFEQLAGEISDIVENTEFNGNKLFGSDGQTISISIGNGSTINIFSKDLGVDIEGLDLTTDAEGALAAIQRSVSEASYYSGYLEDQVSHLESMADLVELENHNDMGFEADEDEFDMDLAKEVAGYASSQTLEDMSVLFDAQANVEPERALQLLKDKIEELSEEQEEDGE